MTAIGICRWLFCAEPYCSVKSLLTIVLREEHRIPAFCKSASEENYDHEDDPSPSPMVVVLSIFSHLLLSPVILSYLL